MFVLFQLKAIAVEKGPLPFVKSLKWGWGKRTRKGEENLLKKQWPWRSMKEARLHGIDQLT